MPGTKDMQQIVDTMLKQGSEPDSYILGPDGCIANGQPDQIEVLSMVIQNLEMGMMHLVQNQQSMGMALDTSRLTIQLLIRMLVEKELVGEEEFKTRYKTDVAEKMIEMQKQLQEQIKKQIKEQQTPEMQISAEKLIVEEKTSSDSQEETKRTKCNSTKSKVKETEEVKSDVVLPSERENSVMRFPANKE